MPDEVRTEELVSTENYTVWLSFEPDDETLYHIEMGQVTVHLFVEEWDELLDVIAQFRASADGVAAGENFAVSAPEDPEEDEFYYLEMAAGTLNFTPEDWDELLDLIEAAREEIAKRG